MPPEITTHVATVLQSTSVFVESQIAKMHETMQTIMQIVKTVNETALTKRGFINPRLFLGDVGSDGGVFIIVLLPNS